MDKNISAAEANRKFSRLLKEVKVGKSYTVTNHGEPVARIVPIQDAEEKKRRDKGWKELLERLKSQPAMNSGSWSRDEAYE
jgi:prevent-host-death family protein